MNTISDESNSNVTIAETYYQQMLKKNFDAMGQCLHPEVHFIGPLAEMYGKAKVVEAAIQLSALLGDIQIRSKFSAGNQIVLVYDFTFSNSIGMLRAAVLMEFQNQLISKIELFYDARPFEKMRSEIFK